MHLKIEFVPNSVVIQAVQSCVRRAARPASMRGDASALLCYRLMQCDAVVKRRHPVSPLPSPTAQRCPAPDSRPPSLEISVPARWQREVWSRRRACTGPSDRAESGGMRGTARHASSGMGVYPSDGRRRRCNLLMWTISRCERNRLIWRIWSRVNHWRADL